MSYKNPNASTKKITTESQNSSILFWILSAFTILFLFWAPFQKALFNGNTFDFERPLYSSFVWVSIILFLMSIYMFYNWKLRDTADVMSILVWLIPLSFVVALSSAASSYFSMNMVSIQFGFIVFFLLGVYICRSDLGDNILRRGLMTSGYVIVLFGLFNWFGNKEGIYKLVGWLSSDSSGLGFYKDAVMTDANGVRLTSVFQYANTYAAYLIALLLCALYLVVTSKKWTSTVVHGLMTVPIIVSFFLTLSRGGFVVLPIILLLILPFLKPYKQVLYLMNLIISFIVSILILSSVTNLGIELNNKYDSGLSLQGWGILIAASIINAGLTFCVQKYIAPLLESKLAGFEKKRFSSIILPIGALILGIIGFFLLFNDTGFTKLLPENIKTRIESINFQQHSVLERGTFYKDAIKLYQDYPVLGAGGGAWSALYEKYQNNPYVSRQAHNFFLQYLVEVGAVGFTILLLVIAAVMYLYIKNYIKNKSDDTDRRFVFFIVTISLLVHSMIDFDLSYVYLGVLLFLSLGAMISKIEVGQLSEKWTDLNKYRWAYPSVLVILSLIMFFNSTRYLSANSNFRSAISIAQSSQNINEILVPLNAALQQHPNHPDYTAYKIDILFQVYNQTKDEKFYNEAASLIQQTREKEPYNRTLLEKEIHMISVKNQLPKALELINQQINNFPWDISLYERSVFLNFDLGEAARMSKNTSLSDQYWNQAFDTYNKVLAKTKHLEALPKEQLQGRAFGLSKDMAFTLGQIEYIRGNYSSAENFLKFELTDQFDDEANKQKTRWYLAALQKQNRSDQAMFDKLVATDPKERDEINKLATATF
jgi:hypothetical protein